jgi:predicted acyltransferase
MEMKKDTLTLTERLASLDVMRGFDMLWIIGLDDLIQLAAKTAHGGWLQPLADQMNHCDWAGFHFEDLIFPMFMFISGVAIPYAITSRVEKGISRNLLLRKIIKRGIILILLGIIYNGALANGFSNMRVASVLAQVGLGYLFAATINLYTPSFKARLLWLAGILAGIAAIQLFVPVPGYGAGLLDPVGGINAWLDRLLLPGKLYGGTYDPEGVLCIVSAISVTLMGTLAGSVLRDGNPANRRKVAILAISGAGLVTVALLLSPFYPIIKKAWTVPFNLLTAGISFIVLSIFYYLIDVKKWKKGVGSDKFFFFKVIGMNAITIYLLSGIVNFEHSSKFFLGWLALPLGDWIIMLGVIGLEWLLLYYLYQKKIFLRV